MITIACPPCFIFWRGSLRQVVNLATGEIKKQITYDEYGNVLSNYGNLELPFGYAGGIYDEQTKLVRFGARDYNAVTGRWNAKDPIGFNGGDYNLFGYVINDPINMLDTDGEDAFLAFDLLVGSIFALADWNPKAAIIMASAAIPPIMATMFESISSGKGNSIKWNEDQDALIKLAREAKRKGAVQNKKQIYYLNGQMNIRYLQGE